MKKLLTFLLVLTMLVPCFSAFSTPVSAAVSSEGRLPFEDISSDHWAYSYAEFCYANGYIAGQGNNYTFAGDANLTRATFVVILARVMEADVTWYTWSSFKDCPEGTWYTPSVMWASEDGYVNGTGNGKFSPDGVMTREQAAVMFARILRSKGYPDKDGSAYKYDLTGASGWALKDIKYTINYGIMSSTTTNGYIFSALRPMTRAQIAKMFTSFMEEFDNCDHSYRIYPTCTNGEYCADCGLLFGIANGHDVPGLSCTSGGYCSTCGDYVYYDEGLHDFSAPTCTYGSTCYNCGYERDDALGHTTKFGVCTRCYSDVFPSEYYRAAYYMTVYGEDNYDGTYSYYYFDESSTGQDILCELEYNAYNESFEFLYSQTTENGNTYVTTIEFPYYSSSYTTYIFAWDYYGDTFIEGDGYVSYDNYFSVSYEYDTDYNLSTIKSNIEVIYDNSFGILDDMLYDLCYSSLYSAFGI